MEAATPRGGGCNRTWQVLGCLPSDRRVEVKERLLGLLPPSSGEGCEASAKAGAKQEARSEELRYNSVVAVNPGAGISFSECGPDQVENHIKNFFEF